MTDFDREAWIDQMRAMSAGRGDGIDLDTPFHWVIEGLKNAAPFFGHLPVLLPADAILYLEGTSISPEVAGFYTAHRAREAVDVIRDTIWPVPDIYHMMFSPELSMRLRQLSENHAINEMFDHIKAYKNGTLLFTFHDAFEGWMRISERVPEEAVVQFCKGLGVSSRREETQQRDMGQIRQLLKLLDDPRGIVIRDEGTSWFRRLWRKFKK